MTNAARYWRTVRHLRAAQLFHRVRLGVRRRWWSRAPARVDARYRARARGGRVRWDAPGLAVLARLRAERLTGVIVPGVARGAREDVQARAEAALAGRFTFLGETRELGVPVPWDRPDLLDALLWKTHLHEFPYALDLALAYGETKDPRYRDGFFALARSWVAAEPIGKPGFARAAWNERAVATRLLHWLSAGALFGLREGNADADWLGEEIVRHVFYLRENLALDLQANHLFRDCIGLVIGHAVTGACPDSLALLEREVREQILPDGAHYERSAMYHAVCLTDLIDVAAVLGEATPTWLRDALRRAAGFLESVLLGDGDLPLLGDAWRGEVDVARLLDQARTLVGPLPVPVAPERASGLVRLERAPVRAVIRAGAHGPDHQLGHAHADLLSFDLSYGPHRLVTDTGTSCYAEGAERDALRRTSAHNTIEIDGAELLETWSSFRSGRRGRARVHGCGEADGFAWLWASHDGYRWLADRPVHHRLLAVSAHAALVVDAVVAAGRVAPSDRRHRFSSRLHLHPDAPPAALRIHPLAGALTARTAPFHERFGESRPMRALVLETETTLPYASGFWLRFGAAPESNATPQSRVHIAGREVEAEIVEGAVRVTLEWRLDAARDSGGVALRAVGLDEP